MAASVSARPFDFSTLRMQFPVRLEGQDRYLTTSEIREHPEARAARASALRFRDYVRGTLGWGGFSGRGLSRFPELVISDSYLGASLLGESVRLGGARSGPFTGHTAHAADVVAHELAHHLVDDAVPNLPFTAEGRVVSEALADIYAAAATRDPVIGEAVTANGFGIRSLERPQLQRADYGDLRDATPDLAGDPHLFGEPVAHAAWVVGKEVGIDTMMKTWHRAVTTHLPARLAAALGGMRPFGENQAEQRRLREVPVVDLLARATLDAAAASDGRGSPLFEAIDAAWKAAGVAPRWRPSALAVQ